MNGILHHSSLPTVSNQEVLSDAEDIIEFYRKDNSLLTMHPIFIGLEKCSICRTIQRKIR